MMITIHGLPPPTKYADLKILIKQKCNITDFILDSLVNDADGSKKVRVGLADDSEGSHFIRCLDGYRFSGHVLRLVPVAKSSQLNGPPQNTYDIRDSYQPRHEPNQMSERSVRSLEAPRPTPWASNNQWTPNQPVPSQLPHNYYQPQQPVNPPFGHSMTQPVKQHFEPRELQSRPQQNQSYPFSQKSNLISLGPQRNVQPNTLREVPETSTRPIQPSRYPPQQSYDMPEKPVTIMKDNFQGPTQYNLLTGHEPVPANYQPSAQPVWTSQHQSKPFEKSTLATYDKKQYDDRKYSPNPQMKPAVEMQKPDTYKNYDKSREFSPPRRTEKVFRRLISPERPVSPSSRQNSRPNRISPGRRISPSNRQGYPDKVYSDRRSPVRRVTPERRISPSTRQVYTDRRSPERRNSPSTSNRRVQDRRFSPSGRQIPTGRMSPTRKLLSPHRRISPPRKEEYIRGRVSPPSHSPMDRRMQNHPSPERDRDTVRVATHSRHESPRRQSMRYSPTRHHAEKSLEYQETRPAVKNIRPAYEPPAQASNEAKYTGGYRPNVREDVQYSTRGQEQRWQEKEFPHKTLCEDRRDTSRLQKFDIPRVSEQQRLIEQELKRSRSRNRSPRSPKRDRSPVRDRYKHSPSSRSPRRSWALEKRRSPDVREPPPPPIWPGQDKNPDYQHQIRSKFNERDDKTSTNWFIQDKKRDDFIRQRNADREHFEEEMKRRQSAGKWKPLSQESPNDRSHKEDKFTRTEFKERRDFIRVDDDRKLATDRRDRLLRQERDDSRYEPDFEEKGNIIRKKEEYSGRIEEKKKEILKKQEQLQKEIDEVYKRAIDFTKKTELYKKGELKKDASYDNSRRCNMVLDSSDSEENYDEYSHKSIKEYSKPHFSKNNDKDYEKASHTTDEGKKKITLSVPLSVTAKPKRHAAIEEIAKKLLTKYGDHLPSDVKRRVSSELELSVSKILKKMFGNDDVSFIELVIKFNSQHSEADEEKIFDDIISGFPTQYRRPKRSAKDDSDIPAKISRPPGEPNFIEDIQPTVIEQNWNIIPSVALPLPMAQVAPSGIIMDAPVMVPLPAQYQFMPTQAYQENMIANEVNKKEGHSLYLCKDDFQPIEEYETTQLKNFLVSQMIKVTQTSQGWAPDFTLTQQQSTHRHEMITQDERSRDWILGLDFSEFKDFNVLVYTTEELWYERAAIWLPGHSRYRVIDPLTKLKLQNKQLTGVNIGKWKFVKQIITEKGTRVYVDMPPSSARALEKYQMQLSYELQKVNVFLKAVAIDKEAFDAGLNEPSIAYVPAPSMTPMPSIGGQDKTIVKIAFKGNKPLSLSLARKVKDTIIYKMYKHHQLDGKSRTDYTKYGFCQPGFFCLLPENAESKKWICNLDLGKIHRTPLIILGTDEGKNKFFNMSVILPKDINLLPKQVCERLRQSNQGVRGINFDLWKNHKTVNDHKNNQNLLNVDMDLESIETIAKMKYRLDFIVNSREHIVIVESNLSRSKLEHMIAKYKAELDDKYDVANMDIDSDSDSEIICLG